MQKNTAHDHPTNLVKTQFYFTIVHTCYLRKELWNVKSNYHLHNSMQKYARVCKSMQKYARVY